MLRWIIEFIEQNRSKWESRDRENSKEKESEVSEMKNVKKVGTECKEGDQRSQEEKREQRLAQARMMKENWRKWRQTSTKEKEEEDDDTSEEEEEGDVGREEEKIRILNPGTGRKEPPGQGNFFIRKRAYDEISYGESNAPWEAGLLADLGGEEGASGEVQTKDEEEEASKEEERMKDLRSYTESMDEEGSTLCFICALCPCTCALRRIEERMQKMRKEEEKEKN